MFTTQFLLEVKRIIEGAALRHTVVASGFQTGYES